MNDVLESCMAQLVYDPVVTGLHWEEVYGRVVGRLSPAIRRGEVPRALAVARITHALRARTTPEDAAWLAEILPWPGTPEPIPPAVEEPRPHPRPEDREPECDLDLHVSGFSGPRDNRPKGARLSWARLAHRLQQVRVYPSKERCPLWSPARFAGDRRLADEVVEVSCLVLDFDDGVGWDEVLPTWKGVAGVVHTSWSHTPDHPKWRLVMPLLEPVPGTAWKRVWSWASERVGGRCDVKCKDPGRVYFAPAVRSEDWPHQAFEVEGRPLLVPLSATRAVEVQDGFEDSARRRRREIRHQIRDPSRGEVYRTDAEARRSLGLRLGGRLVSNGTQVKGVTCPRCSDASLSWWVQPGTQLQARCNHRKSCRAAFWLDELESV